MGRAVEHGRTLIVCGEGGGRLLADRMDAWLNFHEISDDTAARECIRVTEYPIPLLDEGECENLLSMVRGERNQGGFDLIVFDTLMSNFGPGNENEQKDMAAFLSEFRRIRLETSAGLLCVHHTGHGDKGLAVGNARPERSALSSSELVVYPFAFDGETNIRCQHVGGASRKHRKSGCLAV